MNQVKGAREKILCRHLNFFMKYFFESENGFRGVTVELHVLLGYLYNCN